jgi:putative glycerol-1-phosphate prenyltransferase
MIDAWRHVFKLDPDRPLSEEALDAVCTSGTDAVIVGGTQNVTYENTVELLGRIRRYAVPCALEISNTDAVVPGFDVYLLPVVLNAGHRRWLIDAQLEGVKKYGNLIPWEQVVVEGYLIGHADSAVGRLTDSRSQLTLEDVKAYAVLAERMFRLPVFYVEFSGTLGKPEWLAAARSCLRHSRLFYGGGIRDGESAAHMARWADTVVVGNVIYEDLPAALSTLRPFRTPSRP